MLELVLRVPAVPGAACWLVMRCLAQQLTNVMRHPIASADACNSPASHGSIHARSQQQQQQQHRQQW